MVIFQFAMLVYQRVSSINIHKPKPQGQALARKACAAFGFAAGATGFGATGAGVAGFGAGGAAGAAGGAAGGAAAGGDEAAAGGLEGTCCGKVEDSATKLGQSMGHSRTSN